MLNEQRSESPLLPLAIFRIRGLAAADATQLIGIAGFLAMFFFLTLYMQNVLGYSPIQTGAAYLPVCLGVAVAAGVTSQLVSRTGTRPLIVTGALVAAGGVYWLSLIPVDGSYLSDLLARHAPVPDALTSGFHRALLASCLFLVAAAVIALRATNTRGETDQSVGEGRPELALS